MKPKIIKSEAPRPLAHYNEGAQVGPWVFPAGQIASDYKTGVAPAARRNPGFPYYGSDIKLQTRYVLENLRKTFAAAGSSFEHVVKAQVFLTDLKNFNGFDARSLARIFSGASAAHHDRHDGDSLFLARWSRST